MALRFDLSDLNPPTWFDHPEDNEARICLRVAAGKDFDKIRSATTKRVPEYRRGQRFEVEKVDEELRSEMTWQHCLVDWEGIVDSEGESIECTPENKVLLMQGSPRFAAWVSDCLEILNQAHAEKTESAEKNS